ncbi:MAG: GNAT family N-acetyltransferase [Spirochaetaceae bacterium]
MDDIRTYQPDDLEQAQRVWKEVGWIIDKDYEPLRILLEDSRTEVGLLRGAVESMAITEEGSFRYLDEDLPMTVVAAVTTSLIARRQGLAGRTTAQALRTGAEAGDLVAALGIFDQGYYDRLGFGTMPYTHRIAFDPAQLIVPEVRRAPHRFDASHSEAIHRSRLGRMRGHGSVNIRSSTHTRTGMLENKESRGLGFYDESGEISHHMWGRIEDEHGPFHIWWTAYRNYEELMELLSLLRSLADQVHLVHMEEPRGIVLQDFLKTPFKFRRSTAKGKLEQTIITAAASQLRLLDIPRAVEKMRLPAVAGRESLEFNLTIDDPVERYLPEDAQWRGCGGSYVVRLGERCSAERGRGRRLPQLRVSIGGFSQLWSGARTVEHLHLRGVLETDANTRERLGRLISLPIPGFEWLF